MYRDLLGTKQDLLAERIHLSTRKLTAIFLGNQFFECYLYKHSWPGRYTLSSMQKTKNRHLYKNTHSYFLV